MYARLARLLTGPTVLAAALAGCGQDRPTKSAATLLLPKAAPLCSDAFARGRLTSTPPPGSVRGSAVVLEQFDAREVKEKYRGDNPPLSKWWTYEDLIRAEAKTEDSVQTLVCIRVANIQIGIYQPDDIAAVRVDYDVRVVRWP